MYCVLVAGPPASGKSTLAAALSRELQIPLFSKDSIKELLFDTVGFRSRAEKVALGVGSLEILYYAAGQVLERGGSVILENNFETGSRPGLEALLARFSCAVATVLLTGDEAVFYRRFLQRDLSPGRHRGHVVNTCYPESSGPAELQMSHASKQLLPERQALEQFISGARERGMTDFTFGETIRVDATDPAKLNAGEIACLIKARLNIPSLP